MVFWTAWAFSPPGRHRYLRIALAVSSLWSLDLLVAGALGGFVALGVALMSWACRRQSALAWTLGLACLAVKPHTVLLVRLLSFAELWRWPRAGQTRTGVALVALGLISMLVWSRYWVAHLKAPACNGARPR